MGSVKEAASDIERQLREVSEAHQAERKELTQMHSRLSLSQGTCSQEEASGESGSLRAQLVSLSTRHRQLLECFKKQREIGGRVRELIERESKGRRTSESNGFAMISDE